MDKVVMCFPGQGSQKPKMALDLYDYSKEVRTLFEIASDISKLNLHQILEKGDPKLLKQTEIAQNAIVLASLSSFVLLKQRGIHPIAVAGFSLGELMALRACNSIDDETLFKLIRKRSSLMARYSEDSIRKYGDVAMAAVVGLDVDIVEDVIHTSQLENVYVANNNSRSQVVVSGIKTQIERLSPLLKEKGARRIILLQVSGPFHTPLLKEAEIEFDKYLSSIKFENPTCALYSNVTGKIEFDIKPYLSKQITNRVQWVPIMKDINKRFKDYKILEVGVSTVLSNLFKSENMICTSCGTIDQIRGL